MTREYTLSDFDFFLPPELIAQHPLPDRSASRLLLAGAEGLRDLGFADLLLFFRPGDVLVFNDTRVIKARLFGRKPSGGKVELLIERITAPTETLALVRTSHTPRVGQILEFDTPRGTAIATVLGREHDFFRLRFDRDVLPLLDAIGHVPLPPYIAHADDIDDVTRYQTVYATQPGAVAAPTAGLHFTPDLLDALRDAGVTLHFVTLHVGAGTFQPVRSTVLSEHKMHSEWYSIAAETADALNAARARGARITAVGTTTLRALESAVDDTGAIVPGARDTALFITPGFAFRVVDRLITNFHLPKSTLLMLVSAFAGFELIRAAYAHAITQRYRFFSYGDAMLLERAQ